jgi:hypothetical protein
MVMRFIVILTVALGLSATTASAQTIAQQTCGASYEALSSADKSKVAYGAFTANCEQTREKWETQQAPAMDPGLAHVTGICADHTYTTTLVRADACAAEGGVSTWFFGNYTQPQPEPLPPDCTGSACEEKPHRKPDIQPIPAPPSQKPATPIIPSGSPVS